MAASGDGKDGESSGKGRSMKKNHVKRPMNAFMIWGRAERRRLAVENPIASNGDLSRILGHRWNAMNDDQREPFLAEAERLRKEHRRQYPDYKYRPRPPRRRLAAGASHNQDCNTTALNSTLDETSMRFADGESNPSHRLMSVLQECSVTDLLNALASKITPEPTDHQDEANSISDEANSAVFSRKDMPFKNLYDSPRSDQHHDGGRLAGSGRSLADEVQLTVRGVKPRVASSPMMKNLKPTIASAQQQDKSSLHQLQAHSQLSRPTDSRVLGIPAAGYSQQRPFSTPVWLSEDSHVKRQGHLYGQVSTLAAMALPVSSCAAQSLASASINMQSNSYGEHMPRSCPSSTRTAATNMTQAVAGTRAGIAIAPSFIQPYTAWR